MPTYRGHIHNQNLNLEEQSFLGRFVSKSGLKTIIARQWGEKSLDNTQSALQGSYRRLDIGWAIVLLGFGLISIRLFMLTAFGDEYIVRTQESISAEDVRLAERSSILDRNGTIMARSLPSDDLVAYPERMINIQEAAEKIASVLPRQNVDSLIHRFSQGRTFRVQRTITPREKHAINALGIPGLEFEQTEIRIYPQERVASHILGGVNASQHGRMGLEKSLEERLTKYNKPVYLSIDARVQSIVHEELSQTMKKYRAKAMTGIVMDVNTGEIISMVSLPDFDIDRISKQDTPHLFNRATQGVYELGSTMKILNTALVLENSSAKTNEKFDVENDVKIGQFTIKDNHPLKGKMSMADIFIHSSNTGSARMALSVGSIEQEIFLGDLGLLERTPLEIAETGQPLLPQTWGRTTTATISFGHGLSVSPLSLLTASNAIINGGILHTPTLLPVRKTPKGKRVISEDTSHTIRQMMRLNVTVGTGGNADVPGYLVGGKTGTADIWNSEKGYDSGELLVSFLGAFPINKPQYSILVTAENPKVWTGRPSGGRVTAPAVGNIIRRSAPILKVRPVSVEENKISNKMVQSIAYRKKRKKQLLEDWD